MSKISKLIYTATLLGNSTFLCAQSNEKPNIILINIDDLGWADLSSQGSEYYETPNIDALRNEAIYFSNGYAPAANSAPSRASMMTGVYPQQHGVYTVNPPDRGDAKDRKLIAAKNQQNPESCYTLLPQTLQNNGYTTCHIGKWHLGEDPTKQGFDINIAGSERGSIPRYFSPYNIENLTNGKKGEYLTDRLTNEAINFIDSQSSNENPFFIYFATYNVHTPLQPEADLLAKYKAKPATEAHFNPKYAAMIEAMDRNVGRLLAHVKKNGLESNTIIIFTSDNGGLYTVSKQTPLRAGKGSFYEGGIRVPFMVKWLGHTPKGAESDAIVSHMDIYPTLLSILGINSDKLNLVGEDISHIIEGSKQHSNRKLFWHFPAYLEGGNSETTDVMFRSRPVSVIRQGSWKLIYNYETGIKELYDLSNDIGEKHDLSLKEPKLRDKLYKELKLWLRKSNAPTEFEMNPLYETIGINIFKNTHAKWKKYKILTNFAIISLT